MKFLTLDAGSITLIVILAIIIDRITQAYGRRSGKAV